MPAAAFTDWMANGAGWYPGQRGSGRPAPSMTRGGGAVGDAADRAARWSGAPCGGGRRHAGRGGGDVRGLRLWQVFRWGGTQHQVLIGGLVFFPVEGCAALLSFRVSRRADLGRRTCRAWRLIFIAVLFYMLGDLLRLLYAVVPRQGDVPPGPTRCI